MRKFNSLLLDIQQINYKTLEVHFNSIKLIKLQKNELEKVLEKVFCTRVLTTEEYKTSEVLFEFISDNEAAENAKSFARHHESLISITGIS